MYFLVDSSHIGTYRRTNIVNIYHYRKDIMFAPKGYIHTEQHKIKGLFVGINAISLKLGGNN